MKTRFFLFVFFAVVSLFTKASVGDTTWILTNSGKGIRISVANDFLHYNIPSVIKVETESVPLDISVVNGIIEHIGGNRYRVTPTELNNMSLIVNKQYFVLDVSPVPDPEIFLSGDSRRWAGVITMEDLKNSDSLIVDQSFGNFEFVSAVVTYMNNNGDLVDLYMKSTSFPKELISKNIWFDNGKLWIEKIMLKAPDGTIKVLRKEVSFRIIDSYENEFVRKTVSFLPNSTDLGLMKTDLRINIEGIAGNAETKAVNDLATELNGILQTIKVRIVDHQPNLRIIFDSTFSDSALIARGFTRNSAGLILRQQSLFFPFRQGYIMYVNPNDYYYSEKALRRSIVELLGFFRSRNMMIGKDSTIFDGANDLSSLDKNLLKQLYSEDGEYQVKQIINKDETGENRTEVFIIVLIFSICLFFLFSEIYKYYGFDVRLKKIRFNVVGRIIESLLVAQIPVIAVLILLAEKFFAGDYHEAGMLLLMEYCFVPFAVFSSFLFLALDGLLKHIAKRWISAFANLILSFVALFISYQLIYLFVSPEIISLSKLSWQVLLVGFIIILYRLYTRVQSQKIAGLLQQKELELTKQKELKFKSDLNALQARINPHFLYNSLNSIASLAHNDADKTEQMAISLSKLFRYNLNKEDDLYAAISDEAEMAAIYLGIEKIRFEDKMSFSIVVQESLKSVKVPKFILQPLAENAVKHGISKLTGQGNIDIRVFEKDEKIVVEVADNGPEFPGGLMNGYGLQNVYDKLKLLYKKPFDVEFVNSPEKKVVLTLSK